MAHMVNRKQAYLILDVLLTIIIGVNIQQPNNKCSTFERKSGAFLHGLFFL